MFRLAALFWTISVALLPAYSWFSYPVSGPFPFIGLSTGIAATICGFFSLEYSPRLGGLFTATGMILAVFHPIYAPA